MITREFLPSQSGDVPLTWTDVQKAERRLGHRPGMSFRVKLERFVEWMQEYGPQA